MGTCWYKKNRKFKKKKKRKENYQLCSIFQVMPLLRILYHAQDKNSHHIYMALIILLVLSEDDVFNKAVHEIVST